MEQYQKDFMDYVLKRGALKFGEFKLKSGRLSPYFFNTGNLSKGADDIALGDAYANTLREYYSLENRILYGPAYKGIPLVVATAISLMNLYQQNVSRCFNRKEAKDHGEGGILVGEPLSDGNIIVLDDVITAGTAARESIEIIAQNGGNLVGMCIALDRQERGTGELSAIQEIEQKNGIKVMSIVTFADLLEYCKNTPELQFQVPAMAKYHAEYGVE